MQPQDKPNLHYPKMKYHWTKDPAIVNNADDGAALGGGWADTPAAFAPYRGPRPPRTADQKAIKWVALLPICIVGRDGKEIGGTTDQACDSFGRHVSHVDNIGVSSAGCTLVEAVTGNGAAGIGI